MNVAFCVQAFNPCQWYRMLEPARVFPGARLVLGDPRHALPLRGKEVVQFSYVTTRAEVEAMEALRAAGAVLALDYDDDVVRMGADADVVRAAIRLADVVTVSTEHLGGVFGQLAPGAPWAVLPNRIDTLAWEPGSFHWFTPVIAYAGSKAHTRDFEYVAPDVWNVMRRRPSCRLRLLGCDEITVPEDLAGRVVQASRAPLATHRLAFAALQADIALAPLQPNEFNRGRSELKFLQFAAMGVPVVATMMPPYAVIEHGVTGFTVPPSLSWRAPLLNLLDDSALRRRIGDAARNFVFSRYDLTRDAPVREAIYQQAINRARARERN